MSQTQVIDVMQSGLYTIMLVASPPLIVALLIGLIVSVFQAATQINEQTLAFVPKILAVFISIIVFGPWMLNKLTDFTIKLYDYMNMVAR